MEVVLRPPATGRQGEVGMETDKKVINIHLDRLLWQEVRIAALRQNVLVREYVEEALRRAVEAQQEGPAK